MEFEKRKSLFETRDDFIQAFNQKTHSFTVNHNYLSDWTPEEIQARLLPDEIGQSLD
jgi:hypothetical protein